MKFKQAAAITLGACLGACAVGCGNESESSKDEWEGFAEFSTVWNAGESKTFEKGETYTLELNADLGDKNYLKFDYSTTCYLDGVLSFKEKGGDKKYEERFFLKKDDNTFRQILDYYGEYRFDKTLDSVTLRCVGETGGEFKLNSVSAATHPIDFASADLSTPEIEENMQLYITGKECKLGMTLKSGGCINYVSSVNSGVKLFEESDGVLSVGHSSSGKLLQEDDVNLVNAHDTGRYVQQSYYGSPGDSIAEPKDDYKCGTFRHDGINEIPWPYNPVQGGDKTNTVSQIADVCYSSTKIYVKTRPCDWAKQKSVTPFYMENVYEIVEDEVYGEYIRVENRGTDFSGYSHGQPRDQELPAFYGVAALPRLATYKGNNAWTNDAIQYENNLPFWSGATATAANRFKASENWIAWVNEENWGIGLYVPDVVNMLAGRMMVLSTETSKVPALQNSTTYTAPVAQFIMPNYVTYSYTYYLKLDYVQGARAFFESLHNEGTENPDLVALVKGTLK